MSSEAASLLSRARDWASWDPNPTTRASVLSLVAAADLDALRPLFSPPGARLSFGTAGLRAPLRPGPRGMNDLTVVQTSQGLAAHLRATYPGCRLRAAVGRDHRARAKWGLSSARFGRLTAEVFRRSGIFEDVVLLDGTVPTPLVPFAVGRLSETENDLLPTTANGGAGPVRTVGVMITASHNPAEDDGYKLYWTNGCQIVPPVDAQVAAAILQNLTPWRDDYGTDADAPDERDVRLTGRLADLYFRAMAPLRTGSYARHYGSYVPNGPTPPPPVFVYTAMHGVGAPWTARSFRAFGLPPFAEVPSQCAPDPAFPTVPFPNPEERGALDRAIARAREVLGNGASRSQTHAVILANDPDADRLAVAEYSAAEDQTTAFTGDQIGVLLGHWLWTTQKKNNLPDPRPWWSPWSPPACCPPSARPRASPSTRPPRASNTSAPAAWSCERREAACCFPRRRPWGTAAETSCRTRTACPPPPSWPNWPRTSTRREGPSGPDCGPCTTPTERSCPATGITSVIVLRRSGPFWHT
uniref:Alpha-D-phosphohexomutase alpha/beta/alpha domain-containing protein n=1 Tax=Corethron hystrix TaxID=216773 RepID=A0A7S1B5Q9_9STRA